MATNIKETIRKWLADESMNPQEYPDPTRTFNLIITYPQGSGKTMHVVQPKGHNDVVVIHTGVILDDEQVSHFKALQSSEQEEFMRGFQALFAEHPVEIDIQQDNGILKRFVITEIIFRDGLTKDRFIMAVRTVNRVKVLGILSVEHEVGTPLTSSSAPPDLPMYMYM